MARNSKTEPAAEPADPDAGMVREGDPFGSPSVRFCPTRRQNYHLDREGNREYHEVPAGFELDDQGVPQPLPEPTPEPEVTPDV